MRHITLRQGEEISISYTHAVADNDAAMARAADIIRRNTARTSDLISIGGGAYGIAEWDTLEEKEQDAWVALARKVIEVAEETNVNV